MHPCPFQYLFQKVLRYLFRLVRFLSDTALSASLKNFLKFFHGITVSFNYDEYLILPDEDEPLEASVQERKENDDHFFVSYGGAKETYFFSNASFIKDGVRYLIFTNGDVSADDLFKMAAELINR